MRHARCPLCGDLHFYEGTEPKACKRCMIGAPSTRMVTGNGVRTENGYWRPDIVVGATANVGPTLQELLDRK